MKYQIKTKKIFLSLLATGASLTFLTSCNHQKAPLSLAVKFNKDIKRDLLISNKVAANNVRSDDNGNRISGYNAFLIFANANTTNKLFFLNNQNNPNVKTINFTILGNFYLKGDAWLDACNYLNNYYEMAWRLVQTIQVYDNQVYTNPGVSLIFNNNISFYSYKDPELRLYNSKIDQTFTLIDFKNNLNIDANMRNDLTAKFQQFYNKLN